MKKKRRKKENIYGGRNDGYMKSYRRRKWTENGVRKKMRKERLHLLEKRRGRLSDVGRKWTGNNMKKTKNKRRHF